MKRKLVIITNESFGLIMINFCDNIDLKSIPEGLEEKFDIEVMEKFKNFKNKKVDIKKIKIGNV